MVQTYAAINGLREAHELRIALSRTCEIVFPSRSSALSPESTAKTDLPCVRAQANFFNRINVIWVVQSPSAKIFRFSLAPNQRHNHRIPSH
jgi:hypothetical protein